MQAINVGEIADQLHALLDEYTTDEMQTNSSRGSRPLTLERVVSEMQEAW